MWKLILLRAYTFLLFLLTLWTILQYPFKFINEGFFLYFQTSYNAGSPVERFQPSSFDVTVCTPSTMATDINTYQTQYQSTTPMTSPMTSFTDTASFSSDAQMEDSPFGFDSMANASQTSSTASQLQCFGDSPSPIQSIGETYNIHGTYTYLRDDGKTGDLISAFRDENHMHTCPRPGIPTGY